MGSTLRKETMRILFTVLGNSRRSNYLDGDTIRYGNGGGSGTDGSTIIVAEQLALQGHEVFILSEKLEPHLEAKYASNGIYFNPGKKIRGVTYSNFQLDGIENKEFDILVNSLWFHKYDDLPIKVTKALIYWCHMQWIYGIDESMNYAKKHNLKLGFVHISNWEREMNQPVIDRVRKLFPEVKTSLIGNPIMDEMVDEVMKTPPVRKSHKVVFHAAWARGGNVAVQAVRELGWADAEFHAFDYLMCTHAHSDSFFRMHNGVDKKTLFTHIAESEYFIYPLYTPYKDVHKDTFSCVVSEAIALGAIPVTYPLGALSENFDGYCAWLDFPQGADGQKMQKEQLSRDEVGIFTCTANIVEKINYLENNPSVKQDIRSRGKDYIFGKFNSAKIGNEWKYFIRDLIS